jgi:large subunit ribosomal protein L18
MRNQARKRRKLHIRKKVNGTAEEPRMFLFKSNRYFYVGLADDENNEVLMSKRTNKKEKDIVKLAKTVSKKLKKYDKIVFDRSGYKYHGLIEAFVQELRENKVNI